MILTDYIVIGQFSSCYTNKCYLTYSRNKFWTMDAFGSNIELLSPDSNLDFLDLLTLKIFHQLLWIFPIHVPQEYLTAHYIVLCCKQLKNS